MNNKMNSRLMNLKMHPQRDASNHSSHSLRHPGSQLIIAICSLFDIPRSINLGQKTVQLFYVLSIALRVPEMTAMTAYAHERSVNDLETYE